jgi:CP family cyanate transporter-like MFS transporter
VDDGEAVAGQGPVGEDVEQRVRVPGDRRRLTCPAIAIEPRTEPRPALLAGAILLTALNLRTAISSVPPLLDELRVEVPLSSVAAGVLTTLPVICMALGSPVAPKLARRIGIEATLGLMALTVAAGILLRLAPATAALYAGTIVAGLGIAVGNVLVPALIKRDFAGRAGSMTGAYTMAISASGAIGAGLAVPIEEALGRGWRSGLALWALPVLAAAAVWIPWAARGARTARALTEPSPALWRDPLAWRVSLFMGLQSLIFYSVLSWLPALLRSEGVSREAAGALLSAGLLAGIPAGLLVPVVAARMRDQRPAVALTVGVLAAGLIGLAIAPAELPGLWVVLIGMPVGALLSLAFLFFSLRSPDQQHAAELAAMAQTVGYLVAAAGPVLFGVLHHVSGGWALPLAFLLAVAGALLLAGLSAGRDRQVGYPA